MSESTSDIGHQTLIEPHRRTLRFTDQLSVAHHDIAADNGRLWPAGHGHSGERRPADFAGHLCIRDGVVRLQINDGQISVVTAGDAAFVD